MFLVAEPESGTSRPRSGPRQQRGPPGAASCTVPRALDGSPFARNSMAALPFLCRRPWKSCPKPDSWSSKESWGIREAEVGDREPRVMLHGSPNHGAVCSPQELPGDSGKRRCPALEPGKLIILQSCLHIYLIYNTGSFLLRWLCLLGADSRIHNRGEK